MAWECVHRIVLRGYLLLLLILFIIIIDIIIIDTIIVTKSIG